MFDLDDPVEIFQKHLKDKKFTLKMLMGRRNVREMSLFENILFHSKFHPVLEDLWIKFKLGKRPEFLMLVSIILNIKSIIFLIFQNFAEKSFRKVLDRVCHFNQKHQSIDIISVTILISK